MAERGDDGDEAGADREGDLQAGGRAEGRGCCEPCSMLVSCW